MTEDELKSIYSFYSEWFCRLTVDNHASDKTALRQVRADTLKELDKFNIEDVEKVKIISMCKAQLIQEGIIKEQDQQPW